MIDSAHLAMDSVTSAHSLKCCPTLLIAAPASGQGKTTVTCALARLYLQRGLRVTVFKWGCDFIDPQWLQIASQRPVSNLDLWLCGEREIAKQLFEAASTSDLILIEGAMGLYDGDPSPADLSFKFRIPVLAVIDASAMAETFGAIVYGLVGLNKKVVWAGAMANRVASGAHEQMLTKFLDTGDESTTSINVRELWHGALYEAPLAKVPERHLGLTSTAEVPNASELIDKLAASLAHVKIGALSANDLFKWSVTYEAIPSQLKPRLLENCSVAIAHDRAFCFIYPANIETLKELGATISFFSPLENEPLPQCDSVWLPGGYPELFAEKLSMSTKTSSSLADHIVSNKPVWAECGGMIPLFDRINYEDGTTISGWGIIPGHVRMHKRLIALGPQYWDTPQGELRGHTFHFSETHAMLCPTEFTRPASPQGKAEAVYRKNSLRASYFHAWFRSNLQATAQLFKPVPPGG
jgi:cobyrinic acid a,c-diamide synthase